VNIGAGTITCNYDGANKHKTIIGDDVFVGSDTQLVAPVTVGNGVTIAAGTTVTRNVADNELVLSRVPQVHKQGWQRPVKKKVTFLFRLWVRDNIILPRQYHKNNPTLYKARGARKTGKTGQRQRMAYRHNQEIKLCVELLAQSRSVILLKSFSKVYVVWNTVVMTLPVWQWSMRRSYDPRASSR
jgi:hypothetical protein